MKLFQAVLLGLFLMAGVTANAQEKKDITPEERAEKMTQKLSEKLSLSEDKTAQLKTLNTNFMVSIHALKQDESLSKEDRKAKAQKLHEDHKADLKGLFSEEEYKQFEVLEARKKERVKEMKARKNMLPKDRADLLTKKMVESLDLNETQTKQVSEINIKVEEKIEAIRKNETMTPEKKKEFIKGNRQDQKNAFKAVLTVEQMEKLKEAQKARDMEKDGHHDDEK